jgi:SMI1-KNR4 cell-wall
MGDYDRAISDFDQAIELDPSLLAARQARRRVQRMPSAERAFDGFNFEEFWDDHPYSLENYVEAAPSDELIASIEEELGGFRLPAAYVELVRKHNGGQIKRNCYPMDEPTGWAEGHIEISGLYAIGRTSLWSLCGPLGSKFHEREWGYPAIGVASTPTAGHQQIMLDYRTCGKRGEPHVVYVDQEDDYHITLVAPDFATFIWGLVSRDAFDTSEKVRKEAIIKVEHGALSPIVLRALAAAGDRLPDGERTLRRLGRQIVDEKGYFSLHGDERSYLMYDAMFWLYSHLRAAGSLEEFVNYPGDLGEVSSYDTPCYELMIVGFFPPAAPYGFHTDGYCADFLQNWWDARLVAGDITETSSGYRFTLDAEHALLHRLATVRDVLPEDDGRP